MSSDFYTNSIVPYSGIIIKICRAYTDSQEDFEDYYQEVCLQVWRTKDQFRGESKWSTWVYRLSLNICLTMIKKKKNNRQHTVSDYEVPVATEDNHAFSDESLNLLYDAIKQLSE
ncbi:MAG: sigma-70 family RNA polymerase sigma factor, partial [Lutibacter sp.]|uniref:sigma-70 family RNA polymerase sigma factor n=1 Tax=Lutibacter sp. TaxID=1925666 RepID=UPI0019D982DC